MKKRITAGFLFILFILCSAISIMLATNIQRCWGERVSTTLTQCTEDDLSALEVSYPPTTWAAFQQNESQLITGGIEGSQKGKVSTLLFHGNPDSIAHFPMVAGRIPADGEDGVCVIDKGTAFELFRSVDAIGSRVNFDENALEIVGVMDVDDPLLIAPGAAETAYTHIAAENRDMLTAIVSALGDDADPFVLSGMETARLLWFLCGLPWIMVILPGILRMRSRSEVWKVISNVVLCTVLLGTVIALLYCIPIRLLPSRWSDLSFYGEQVRAFRERPRSVPTIHDVLLGRDVLHTCIGCALTLIALRIERKVRSCVKS
ncbi:MAG: ABC transporter permease [Clostridia bacterium]|nr:ABC transporter permease [Clostridia bacterium]